jgi:ABC-type sugar transport system substrate-binding protein
VSIQRWGLADGGQIFAVYGGDGEFVTYADHLTAVAAAEQQAASEILAKYEEIKALIASNDEAFDAGVKAAREAVAANRLDGLITEGWEHTINETIDDALAAIDGVKP